MNDPSLSSKNFLLLCMGFSLFMGGCTFLLNTEELLKECVTEIDCADGFYCDDGACLPGEAPLPFNPEEPNIPSFNDDAGTSQEMPQTPNDAGHNTNPMTDAGTSSATTMDSGVSATVNADAGVPENTVDAGNTATETFSTDAGETTNTMVDAGTRDAVNDAGSEAASGSTTDAGASTSQTADAG
jgi:hypothetical protein